MTTPSLTNPNPKREGETLDTIRQWCEETFGPISTSRIVERAGEEFDELRAEPDNVTEAADVVICLSRFPGLWAEVERKMKINRGRRWRLMGDGTGYHIKDGSAASAAPALVPVASARPSPGDPVRAALEFYARSSSYRMALQPGDRIPVLDDNGDMARAALSVSTPTGEDSLYGIPEADEALNEAIRQHEDAMERAGARKGAAFERVFDRLCRFYGYEGPGRREGTLEAAFAIIPLAHPQQAGERDGTIGPRTITTSRQTCEGCSALVLKDWKFLGEDDELDIGTSAKCIAAADKPINSYWSERTPTPAWCPASKSSGEEA